VIAEDDVQSRRSYAPAPDEQQLPRAMHSAMKHRPVIVVGQREGDLVGKDNRVLQAAVDYVSALGGGTVEIGEGVYVMRDSLHLRSNVTVRGQGERTVLRKAAAVVSPLALDGDFGEEQVTVLHPDGFDVGAGVAIWDARAGGFHTTVARITGRTRNTFSISRPLMADCMLRTKAQAATVFPVISGYDLEDARVERLTIDGNREENPRLNGCRGAGIFLYRGFGTVIENCTVRNYNGDGISFQQSNDVQVIACTSENNAGLGLHPGSGSQRPVIRNSVARGNGEDGLYLCWRVRHGVFEGNELAGNARHGISIGHKDSDNLLRGNRVRGNAGYGVLFRNEDDGMAGHRNRLEANEIEDNGKLGGAGIFVDGETDGVVLVGNLIRDTRQGDAQTQRVGIRLGKRAGQLTIEGNRISAAQQLEDLRLKKE
jgi:parallel beta-helix repeat protein